MKFDPARLARIDALVHDKYIATGRLPHAALLIGQGGEIAHRTAMGSARAGEPLRDNAIFRIASMTKPVTSVAFMQLVEQGRVALGDTLEKFLPEFARTGVYVSGGGSTPFVTRPPAAPIRMIDLLRHTAGLTYSFQERSNIDAAYRRIGFERFDAGPIDAFVWEVANLPLEFDPGTAWNYSVATDIIGAVVERIAGMSLAAYFTEHIFAPLGMNDTQFDVPPDKLDRVPDCYVIDTAQGMKLYDAGPTTAWGRTPGYYSGGGGLTSTLGDYHRFARMLLGRGALEGSRVLAPNTVALMTANHLPGNGDLAHWSRSLFSEVDYEGVGFGLGFSTVLKPTLVPGNAREFGWGGMFSTAFWVDPVDRITMVFMTQLMPSNAYPLRRELKTMIYSALVD